MKNKDFIPHILGKDHLVKGTEEIGCIMVNHFRGHFGMKREIHFKFSWHTLHGNKTRIDQFALKIYFSKEEIIKTTFDLKILDHCRTQYHLTL